MIAEAAITANFQMTAEFDKLNAEITRPPTDIEDLMRIKDFISNSSVELGKLQQKIDQTMAAYDIAIDNGHEFSNGENDAKWRLYGAPQRTQ